MERPPLPRPPYCIHTRVQVLRVLDGDTVEVQGELFGGSVVVRLLGIDAPELHSQSPAQRAKAKLARELLERLALNRRTCSLLVPLPEKPHYNLLREVTSFGRVLGHLYLDDETLAADELVKEGVARWSSAP